MVFGLGKAHFFSCWAALLLLNGCASSSSDFSASLCDEALTERHRLLFDVYALGYEPEKIHEQLSKVFIGSGLTEVFLENVRSLKQMSEENTRVEILKVEYQSVEASPTAADECHVIWTVTGEVSHNTHRHVRRNQYQAVLGTLMTKDGPRIVRQQIQDVRRVSVPMSMHEATDQGEVLSPSEWLIRQAEQPTD